MGRSQKEARETCWNDESCPIDVIKKIWDELDEDEKRMNMITTSINLK